MTDNRALGRVQMRILRRIERCPRRAFASAIRADLDGGHSNGQITGALKRLEARGYLTAEDQPILIGKSRRMYALTSAGRAAMAIYEGEAK